jgi:hypothetical protein
LASDYHICYHTVNLVSIIMSLGPSHHQEPEPLPTAASPSQDKQIPALSSINLPDASALLAAIKGSTQIIVAETNILVRYVQEEKETALLSKEFVSGQIELELRSLTGEEIDTLTIWAMRKEAFKIILETITASNKEDYRNSWQGSAPFLTPARLEKILTVSGAQGAKVETKSLAGISPRHIADDYDEKLIGKPDNVELKEQILKNLEHANTLFLIKQGFDLARQRNTKIIIAPAGEGGIISAINMRRGDNQTIIWIKEASCPPESLALASSKDLIWTPQTEVFSRYSQDRLALLTALVEGKASLQEQILVFQRREESSDLDGYCLKFPRSVFPWLSNEVLVSIQSLPSSHRHALMHVTELALKLAVESIEGKSIGAAFVIADYDQVYAHLSPKLVNPFNPEIHSIYNPSLLESIRAYASADGATIISPLGQLHASGVYITCHTGGIKGLEARGNRHRSAAAITAETSAVAVVISESSGCVTIMSGGKVLIELNRR